MDCFHAAFIYGTMIRRIRAVTDSSKLTHGLLDMLTEAKKEGHRVVLEDLREEGMDLWQGRTLSQTAWGVLHLSFYLIENITKYRFLD